MQVFRIGGMSVKLIKIPRAPKVYLDVVKLLAIVLVVFNHSGSNGYKMYLDVAQGPVQHLLLFASAFVKIAVPLFFMASGAYHSSVNRVLITV